MPSQYSNKALLSDISLEIDEKLDAIETVYIALTTVDSDELNRAISNTLLNALNELVSLNKQLKKSAGVSDE